MEIQNTVNLKHSISLHELCENHIKKLRDWYFNDTPTKDEEKQNITNTPAINFNIDLLFLCYQMVILSRTICSIAQFSMQGL